ncbi:YqgE/AlgH family protein, partial [Streptomyces sp. NPDC005568]|uniref:YqgE/AlgH family protein n=1 Tax=Streptomyces sp. NPDC005568 TaxID=3156887 RepID=UPI0033B07B1B
MTEVSSLTGRLLVATPALADPNFDRAVVLLLDHDEEGSLGVVLNRPTPVDVSDILEAWADLAGEPGVVFQGGPVSLDSALGVAVIPGDASGEQSPLGWRRVHGAIGLVDLEAPGSSSWSCPRCGSMSRTLRISRKAGRSWKGR